MTSSSGWHPNNLLPHYSPALTNDAFVERNIQMSEMGGLDIPDTFLHNNRYIYPGSLTRDVEMTMKKDEYQDWQAERRQMRGDVCPSSKWWQDLNKRHGMSRGFSDNLDSSMRERNNFASGWFNAKCGQKFGAGPGQVPYRNPYVENKCETYNPDMYDQRPTPMNNLSGKHYFYSIYDLEKWPRPAARCTRPNTITEKRYMQNHSFPGNYY